MQNLKLVDIRSIYRAILLKQGWVEQKEGYLVIKIRQETRVVTTRIINL